MVNRVSPRQVSPEREATGVVWTWELELRVPCLSLGDTTNSENEVRLHALRAVISLEGLLSMCPRDFVALHFYLVPGTS